jgi:hypothetical protein
MYQFEGKAINAAIDSIHERIIRHPIGPLVLQKMIYQSVKTNAIIKYSIVSTGRITGRNLDKDCMRLPKLCMTFTPLILTPAVYQHCVFHLESN